MIATALTETGFQAQIVELARICGWRTMHVRRTIGKGRKWTTSTSLAGWPDLAIWRTGQFMLVELKSDTGKTTPEQQHILESLKAASIDTRLWRPKDWPEIQATLTRKPAAEAADIATLRHPHAQDPA